MGISGLRLKLVKTGCIMQRKKNGMIAQKSKSQNAWKNSD